MVSTQGSEFPATSNDPSCVRQEADKHHRSHHLPRVDQIQLHFIAKISDICTVSSFYKSVTKRTSTIQHLSSSSFTFTTLLSGWRKTLKIRPTTSQFTEKMLSLSSYHQLMVLLVGVPFVAGTAIISECSSRLPMSMSTVISDLEAEGVGEMTTACLLTSRGVTSSQRVALFGIDDSSTTSFGTDSGLCVALSSASTPEVASTAVACGGTLIYYPDEDDMVRGEGLFDSLGPAIERVLSEGHASSASLVVVSKNPTLAKSQLEKAAAQVLSNLVSSAKVAVLGDVFESIQYVKSAEDALNALKDSAQSVEAAEAQSKIAATVASGFWQATPSLLSSPMSSRDLAAARQLGPAARTAVDVTLETVRQMSDGVVVPNFGDLCDAATKRAMDDLYDSSSSALMSSSIGKQISENMREDLTNELSDLCERQVELLEEACFDEFKQELSKLRISPNLASDMEEVAGKASASFAKRSKKMPINTADAKAAFKSKLQDFCSERLLAAQASGQFRPVPRKGVTIGFHWLLPKPFGNDYRQEPWMVHATDNLVYIPPDKITDVSPDDVASGDWRRKIVPSPAGNEMLYMQ